MRDCAGEAVGVPPALFGGGNNPIAVNQTVLNTLNATIERWRGIITSICGMIFHRTYEKEILGQASRIAKEIESKEPEVVKPEPASELKDGTKSPGSKRRKVGSAGFQVTVEQLQGLETESKQSRLEASVAKLKETFFLRIELPGLADPLLARQLWDLNAVNEEVFAKWFEGYTGLRSGDVDTKRMRIGFDLKVEAEKLRVEEQRLRVEAARLELAERSRAAHAQVAAEAVSNARELRSLSGHKRKKEGEEENTTYATLEGPSVDRDMAKYGAGKAAGTGKLASKAKRPTSARGSHAK
jgi:hypothetical protein